LSSLSEWAIKVTPAACLCSWCTTTAMAWGRSSFDLPPVGRCRARVHLGKHEAKDALTVLPVQVCQLYGLVLELLLLFCNWSLLLSLKVWLWKLALRVNEGKELILIRVVDVISLILQ
jgi:hypothetical protein